jgi:thiamine-phosphate pyrophosphorylase
VKGPVDVTLVAILDVPFAEERGLDLEEAVDAACRGGAGMIQVRDKRDAGGGLLAVVERLAPVARRRGAALVVNDRADVALAGGADGVHVGRGDLPVAAARRILPPGALVGATARGLEEARAAAAAGADYLGVGSLFPSRTKEAPPMPIERASEIARGVSMPVVGIGGIDERGAARLAGLGLAGVAVSRALFGAPDIARAARDIRRAFEGGT